MTSSNLPLGERLDALKQPSPVKDSYGTHKCGCSWDSGPYGLFCDQHDADALIWDALVELRDAAAPALAEGLTERERERLRGVVDAVSRMIDEGVEPAT